VKDSTGDQQVFLLRRLKCRSCHKLHIELPDIIQPFKHYLVAVIEKCLDGADADCPADDSTIRLWHSQWSQNLIQLNGALKALWGTKYKKLYPLMAKDSLLDTIRNKGPGWLTSVTQMTVIAGFGVPTQFAFSP